MGNYEDARNLLGVVSSTDPAIRVAKAQVLATLATADAIHQLAKQLAERDRRTGGTAPVGFEQTARGRSVTEATPRDATRPAHERPAAPAPVVADTSPHGSFMDQLLDLSGSADTDGS